MCRVGGPTHDLPREGHEVRGPKLPSGVEGLDRSRGLMVVNTYYVPVPPDTFSLLTVS